MSSHNLPMVIDQQKVEALAQKFLDFLPGARDLLPEGRLALAHLSIAHRLDPWLKEAWAIPAKNKQGQIVGFELMVGISGWRRSAHDSGEYWGRRFEPCTDEERNWLNAGPGDLAIKCIVMRRKTNQQPMEFDGYGVFRKGDYSRMNPLQCVRLRAERDAMKAAFPITLNIPGARVNIVDDTGEIINGDIDHGPDLTSLSEYDQEHPPIDAEVSQVQPELSDSTPTDATRKPDQPIHQKPAPTQLRKPAAVAASVIKRWNTAIQLLANEIPYYRYDNGEPNRYKLISAAGQMGYAEINEHNFDAVLQDLKQHALEQTQKVPV